MHAHAYLCVCSARACVCTLAHVGVCVCMVCYTRVCARTSVGTFTYVCGVCMHVHSCPCSQLCVYPVGVPCQPEEPEKSVCRCPALASRPQPTHPGALRAYPLPWRVWLPLS